MANGQPPDSAWALRVFEPQLMYAIGLVWIVLMYLANLVIQALGLPRWVAVAAPALVVIPVLAHVWRRARRRALPPQGWALPLPRRPDPAYRLALMLAAPADLAPFTGPDDALQDHAFEPVVVPVWFAIRGRLWKVTVVWVALGLILTLLFELLKSSVPGFGAYSFGGTFNWWACFGLASFPLAFWWPTYLRVTPGRLETIAYGTLGSGTPARREWDLRDARVRVNLGHRRIELTQPDSTVHWIPFGAWSPRRDELARAVLQAARWQGDHPEAPPESLG